jgi:hypothetical protein
MYSSPRDVTAEYPRCIVPESHALQPLATPAWSADSLSGLAQYLGNAGAFDERLGACAEWKPRGFGPIGCCRSRYALRGSEARFYLEK